MAFRDVSLVDGVAPGGARRFMAGAHAAVDTSTKYPSPDVPRPRPCALLAAAGMYGTSSIAFTSLLDLSARRRHSKGNAKEESARDRQGSCERVVPTAAWRWGIRVGDALCWRRPRGRPRWALLTRDGSAVPRTSVRDSFTAVDPEPTAGISVSTAS